MSKIAREPGASFGVETHLSDDKFLGKRITLLDGCIETDER